MRWGNEIAHKAKTSGINVVPCGGSQNQKAKNQLTEDQMPPLIEYLENHLFTRETWTRDGSKLELGNATFYK